jgi:predicted nucleic acid-binding protein
VIYVDTCLLVYALEDEGPTGADARTALSTAHAPLAISPLVIHELLVMPFRRGDAALVARIESAASAFDLVAISPDDFVRASSLRARHRGLKLADSLHLAAARGAGCTELWTNDSRFAAIAPEYVVCPLDRE